MSPKGLTLNMEMQSPPTISERLIAKVSLFNSVHFIAVAAQSDNAIISIAFRHQSENPHEMSYEL